jgi:hypothetical protein
MSPLEVARSHLVTMLEEMITALKEDHADALILNERPFTGTPMMMLTAAFNYGTDNRVHMSVIYPTPTHVGDGQVGSNPLGRA